MSRILRLPEHGIWVGPTLDRWVREGRKVTAPELRQIIKELRISHKRMNADEVLEWMNKSQGFELSSNELSSNSYHTMRKDLLTKVFGVNAAEELFEGLPSTAKSSEEYIALYYLSGALLPYWGENPFEDRHSKFIATFTSDALTYNEMTTLYMSIGQRYEIMDVVRRFKASKLSPDLFTYNLWISSCAATLDIYGVRRILDEMAHNSNSDKGWTTYMTLTDIYITASCLVGSDNSLVDSENKIGDRELITFDFLIFLYAGLGNRERISEIWKSLRQTSQKMISRNYICILSSYVVLGQMKEAGDVIDEWKQSKDFDILACKRILDAFVNAGLLETAEIFRELMLQKNCELTDSFDKQ